MMAKPCACDTWVGVACAVLWGAMVNGLPVVAFLVRVSGSGLGWSAGVGESPVRECMCACGGHVPE